MSLFVQGIKKFLKHRFAMFFFLYLPVFLGLVGTSGHADADKDTGSGPITRRLEKRNGLNDDHSNRFLSDPVFWELLGQSEYSNLDESSPGEVDTPEEKKDMIEPITRKIPIWGEKVREMGFDLPLPFGAGTNFVWMDQGIDIRELEIRVGSASTELSGIGFSNARSRSMAATIRLDAWLLPFFNIYGLFGYLNGKTDLDVNVPGLTIDVPIIGQIPIFDPFTIPVDVDYDGVTYGGGITLAGGYKRIFATLDMNFTRSDINLTDGEITTLTASPRLGIQVETFAIRGAGAFWIGAMYLDYKETIADSINLRQIDPALPELILDYEVKVENDRPWNFIFGGQWEITKRWQVMAEGGVGERNQLILGAFFRF